MRNTIPSLFLLLILVGSLFPLIPIYAEESTFSYTPIETVKTYDASVNSTVYFDEANYIFITPFGNYTWLQPGNILSFTDYYGRDTVDKSIFVLQYDSYGTWLPLLDFSEGEDEPIIYQYNDTYYDFRYNIYDKKTKIANIRIEFIVDGLYKPKISVSMNRTEEWVTEFGDPDFRWIWDIVPDSNWKYWKNSTSNSLVDINDITGTMELGNFSRAHFTDNSTYSLSAVLDVSDYGAVIFEGGQEPNWNSKGFVVVFPVNVEDIDPITHTEIEVSSFTPSSYSTWEEYDLFTNQGVPKGAVAEIVLCNAHGLTSRSLGVRTKGSSLQRRLWLHEAEGGGVTTATMLVQTDQDGQIEIYVEGDQGYLEVIGYLEGVSFTERFTSIPYYTGSWGDLDLSTYGVPANAVTQILIGLNDVDSTAYLGVREHGSPYNRWVLLDESEPAGLNVISFIVKADGDSIIQRYSQTASAEWWLLGWFGSNVDFTEGWTQITFSGSKIDNTWESRTLTDPPANSIIAMSLVHQDSGVETYCGVREEGASINRYIQEHEAEGGGEAGFQALVNVDADKKLEIYCGDSSESRFFYSGYFSEVAGGDNYYAYPTQTLSWDGSVSREWILSRTFSQGLTFSGSSSRTWSLTRNPTQAITFTSNALADLLEFIQATASIGLTFSSSSSREWGLTRVLSQGLTMTLNANRAFTAIRGVSQSLTAAMSASRTWDLSRTVSQTITFTSNALADLIQIIQRTASIALNLVSDSGRKWTLKRGFSQALSLISNGERMLGAVRMASQSLTASMNVERVFSAIRGASQTLTTTMNTNRAFTAIRTASQTMTTTFNGNRIWSTVREVSQSLTTTLNANRIFTAVRTASQSLTTTLNGNRVFTAIRSASQSLTASISASRTWDLSRTATQAISFTSNALADLLSLIQRTASLGLSLITNTDRSWTLKRILTQSMTFTSNALKDLIKESFTNFHRYVSVGLNLVLDSTRTWDMSRTVSQTITFTSEGLGDLLEFFSRTASLSLNFVSGAVRNIVGWILSLVVTDFDDIPMENATVALTRNNSEAISYWRTNINGSIPSMLLSPDDYFLMISKYNYLTNETWVSLTGNYTLGVKLEGAWIETNPEILGLFGICLIMQVLYAYGLYKGTRPALTMTAGALTVLAWYVTGQVVLSFNQVQGVPISLLLSGFSTVNTVLLFRVIYALMMAYQEE